MAETQYTFQQAFEACRDDGWEFITTACNGTMKRGDGERPYWFPWSAPRGSGQHFAPFLIETTWTRVEGPAQQLHWNKKWLENAIQTGQSTVDTKSIFREMLLLHSIAEKARELNKALVGHTLSDSASEHVEKLHNLLKAAFGPQEPEPLSDINLAHTLEYVVREGRDLQCCTACGKEVERGRCMGEVRADDC